MPLVVDPTQQVWWYNGLRFMVFGSHIDIRGAEGYFVQRLSKETRTEASIAKSIRMYPVLVRRAISYGIGPIQKPTVATVLCMTPADSPWEIIGIEDDAAREAATAAYLAAK